MDHTRRPTRALSGDDVDRNETFAGEKRREEEPRAAEVAVRNCANESVARRTSPKKSEEIWQIKLQKSAFGNWNFLKNGEMMKAQNKRFQKNLVEEKRFQKNRIGGKMVDKKIYRRLRWVVSRFTDPISSHDVVAAKDAHLT